MFSDLREFLTAAEKLGKIDLIQGADWNLEIGSIMELQQSVPDAPLLLFDRIKDYPAGYRLLTCSVSTPNRVAITMGLPTGCSDLELLKIIKADYPALKVVILTGSSSKLNAMKALELGAVDFISKPFSLDDIREAVRRANPGV